MKIFLLIFPVIVMGDVSSHEMKEWLSQVMVTYEVAFLRMGVKKLNPNCTQNYEYFENAGKKVKKCVVDVMTFETNTICGIARAHYQKCSEPLINAIAGCVDREYRDVPSFILNTIDSIINFVCKSKGKHLFELMNPCFWRTEDDSLKTCEKLVNDKIGHWLFVDDLDDPYTVTDICGFFDSVKDCFYNHLRGGCKNVVTLEAFGGLYEALSKECKNSKSPLTNDLKN
ncbi:uncharacterized protein LOC109597149 isoform X1 [Aethina tumida]|uniref:uncharacterized protein LOC109597149 isoform X1 n=2 Tax=Aethina tumida TaxID=116153 RepID=UPI00096B2897|nr:uncharacterized protein LOC109597149 isoform X1 [Aethina tumida]